jgi:UDP-2-acetamido-2-deoxy-ribo-hexuluronate aminotransferase
MTASDAPIRFFDLESQQALIRDRVEARFRTILDHGKYIGGPEVEEMETRLAAHAGVAECIAVGSGTQALVMPMIALGYGYGDAVFLPAFTYNATANAILLAGATPVFVDIDPETFNICPDDLERRILQVKARRDLRARAIVPVDLYGAPADYDRINAIAAAYGLTVIADAAQAYGGAQNGVKIGALAPITGTSFYPTKTLGGYGDGGAIFVTDKDFAETLRSIRWHGTDAGRKLSVRVGINGRCDSIQCAVVCEKLDLFDGERARRAEIAARYDAALKGKVPLQSIKSGDVHGHGLYTIRVKDRARIREALAAAGVPTAIYYDTALHRMAAFSPYAPAGGMPHAEKAADEALSLPMHPYLADAQVDRVTAALLAAL